jgi:hypothetical protein
MKNELLLDRITAYTERYTESIMEEIDRLVMSAIPLSEREPARHMPVSDVKIELMRELLRRGKTIKEVALKLNLPLKTVRNFKNKYKN